ncbi:hypothetical protein [Paractinoplanes brasiliensis]|uniref:Uncharacterized protein n=1 Tax=Paractinoplanes brasiliensis TaxID=52695 RepID=A0A4R6JS93_9ACTN|nr:hypothetical protein [Actinoplanes brasiliensis]TDO37836.1 hypothetical protein C8E87_1471 [Actinoplanes brasiliensis]GID33026.1 hypothetical protein Abr02nite_80090 [Actinoplanes brasiliensis]
MFPYNDPYTMLDLQRQHADELARQAAPRRAGSGPVRRFGRWPRRSRAVEQPARAAVV